MDVPKCVEAATQMDYDDVPLSAEGATSCPNLSLCGVGFPFKLNF